jgi:hypothetical protein
VTVYVHLERVVVDGPLPGGGQQWRRRLEHELGAALADTPAGRASGWPTAGQHLAGLPPARAAGGGPPPSPQAVAAAVGAALATGGRG